jgi:hypothetical protein
LIRLSVPGLPGARVRSFPVWTDWRCPWFAVGPGQRVSDCCADWIVAVRWCCEGVPERSSGSEARVGEEANLREVCRGSAWRSRRIGAIGW